MRIAITRTIPNFSMDVYADSIILALKTVRPDWEIIELAPYPFDCNNSSLWVRGRKFYERFWHFPQTVRQHSADIFHVIDHSEGHIVNWLKKTGKPVIVTCHDLINFFYRENLQSSLKVPILSDIMWMNSVKSMRNANHIITVSQVTAKDAVNILNIQPQQITVIPNTVDPIFRQLSVTEIHAFRQQQGISPETLCLLNVGSNHPRKNLSTILQALKIVKSQGLLYKFWKVGSDFTEVQKQFISNHKLEDNIHYLGQPNKALLLKLYNAADILLAPSLHEGFGITLIEAMACGTPVITSNTSAMPEVVGNAGILVNPTNPEEIASAIFSLHHDQIYYRKLVTESLSRVKNFHWEFIAEKIAFTYEKVIMNQV
ncbi:glycosyltransferase family 4 protein [Calothrix sp. NIES-3974]|uniref:glycosyltransferase family 4 protein n=1 Tax=Calothrix sp. NIES-3974 TaxID=2005462 RepID=UPI000B5FB593|nr:glycosyltransferase family 1 protein [Calothrix sp. NIES-3974]BAZ06804.1 putative glycosyl transferase [Calothrix sp. NIES-3974]